MEETVEQNQLSAYYNLKGFSFVKLGQLGRGLSYIEKAHYLNPSDMKIILNLSEIYRRAGNPEKAIIYLKTALMLSPDNAEVKNRLAQTLISLKRYDEAFEVDPKDEALVKLILQDPFKFVGGCKRCGKCCQQMLLTANGKLIESEAEFEELCKKDPGFQRWVPSGKNPRGVPYFSCRYLSSEGLCTDYENRQPVCRAFPSFPSALKPNCGFKPTIALQPFQVKNLALINRIAEYAVEEGCYEDIINILKIKEDRQDRQVELPAAKLVSV